MVKIVGKRVKELRKKMGYSLEYAGQFCNCTKQNIDNIEKKRTHSTSEAILEKLAQLLGCTPDYLQGDVNGLNQVLVKSLVEDSNGEITVKKEVFTLALRPGDFRSQLLQKVLCLPVNRQFILNSVLDFIEESDDSEVLMLDRFTNAIIPHKEQFTAYKNDPQFYIYQKLAGNIMKEVTADAYDFIYSSDISPSIKTCDLEEVRQYIDQALGDFKKETKLKLHIKIRSAVIGHKNQTSHPHAITREDLLEIVDNYSKYIYDRFHTLLNTNNAIVQGLPHTKTLSEHQQQLQELQKGLYFMAQKHLDDIKKFFLH